MSFFLSTMYFKIGSAGWSESWYLERSTSTEALASLEELAKRRGDMMGTNATINFLRVSNPLIRGDSDIKAVNISTRTIIHTEADMSWTGCLARIEAGALARRMAIFRGIPDLPITTPQTTPCSNQMAEFRAAFDLFRDELLAQDALIRAADKTVAERVITGMEINPANKQITVTAPGHGYSTNQLINLLRVKSIPKLERQYRITVLNADNFTLQGTNRHNILWLNSGFCMAADHVYLPVTAAKDLGTRTRKPGRPFDSPVGRS